MPMIDAQIPDLMSVTEVAQLKAVSRTAVQKMIDDGRLPALQVGRVWVIRRAVAEGVTVDIDAETDADSECEGHESLDGAHMGETVYCDGSCRRGDRWVLR